MPQKARDHPPHACTHAHARTHTHTPGCDRRPRGELTWVEMQRAFRGTSSSTTGPRRARLERAECRGAPTRAARIYAVAAAVAQMLGKQTQLPAFRRTRASRRGRERILAAATAPRFLRANFPQRLSDDCLACPRNFYKFCGWWQNSSWEHWRATIESINPNKKPFSEVPNLLLLSIFFCNKINSGSLSNCIN